MNRHNPPPRPPSPFGGPGSGSRTLIDALGQPIGPGDLVQYIPVYPMIYTVLDIRPEVNPRAPQGTVLVTLQVNPTIAFQGGRPAASLIKVGTLASREELSRNDQAPGPESPVPPAPADRPSTASPEPGGPDGSVPGPEDRGADPEPTVPGPRLIIP